MDKTQALQNLLNGTASKEDINLLKGGLASGEISIGGNVNHSVIIIGSGNTVELPSTALDKLGGRSLLGDLDRDLTGDEIAVGLNRLEAELPVRAPILLIKFQEQTRRLRPSLKTNSKSLSDHARKERVEALAQINSLCMETLDISFNALCLGEELPKYDSRSPFRGLESFHPEDSEFFFGREALTKKLVGKINSHPFLAVLGASGSGKSSLVMAGLIPTLDAKMVYLTPSSSPLYQLQSAKDKAEPGAVYVVDQFEELFILVREASEREEFVRILFELSKTNRVVITMRADFWGEVATYNHLKQQMQDHQELIAPMDADELHYAMKKQAEAVGLRFDPILSELILAEVKDEPGAMPLLQHALWMLWKRRHGLWLKAEEYQAFGGIRRAIATTADELYENFSPSDRERMRNVFVRLTRIDGSGKTTLDTRRRVRAKELIYRNDTITQTVDFVRKLANARLLITSAETLQDEEVEVAHEALIRNWPRLRGWLDEDRLSLLVQEQIHDAAAVWDASDGDTDAIIHYGGKLEDAHHLMRNPRIIFNELEARYLQACQKKDGWFGKSIQNALRRWLLPLLIISGVLFVFVPFFFFSQTSPTILFALAIGTVIPLLTEFLIYRQDRYRIVETKWVAACLFGGIITYWIAARINPALVRYEILSWETVIRYAAPVIETALKGLILYLIMSRLKFSRTVDGIIYGAAVGAGFAAIENYEYILGNPENAIMLATARVFSTNFVHMGVLGLSGFLLVTAQFDKTLSMRAIKILGALTAPAVIASIFNIMVSMGTLFFVAMAFGISLILTLRTIIQRLIKQEEKWISQFLQGGAALQSNSAVNNVERIAKNIRELFGFVRASQVERYLILQARRGILQKALDEMDVLKWRRPIEEQIQLAQKRIRGSRAALGTYCWENIKAIIPEIGRIADN